MGASSASSHQLAASRRRSTLPGTDSLGGRGQPKSQSTAGSGSWPVRCCLGIDASGHQKLPTGSQRILRRSERPTCRPSRSDCPETRRVSGGMGQPSTQQVGTGSDRTRPPRAGIHATLHEWIELKKRWLVSGLSSTRLFDRTRPVWSSCCIRTSPSAASRADGGLGTHYSTRCPARQAPTNHRRCVT